jgi:glycosyltransferase involved in cell wall biosynthesis
MSATPQLSIVVPLYNEELNVAPLCAAVRQALAASPYTYELLLVDDGSDDRTRPAMEREAREDSRLRLLAMRGRSGQTMALAAGFARARGRIVVSMDGDLQNDPRDIPLLVSRLERGCDVVCGWRKERQDAFLSRKVPSWIANRCITWLTGIGIHDSGCTLKAFRAEVVQALHLYAEMHRFLPAFSAMTGARIAEVAVRHHPRRFGQAKYGISRTFKVLGDMVTAKMITQFASRPGAWFSLLALPWLLLALSSGAFWLDAVLQGRQLTIVAPTLTVMFVYLGAHMISLAFLSELFLAQADRDCLHRMARALAAEVT